MSTPPHSRQNLSGFPIAVSAPCSLLTNGRTTFPGEYYVLTDAMNNPKSLQRSGAIPTRSGAACSSFTGDVGGLRADVAAMETAGVDLVIVGIPKTEPPTVIERIAKAIT